MKHGTLSRTDPTYRFPEMPDMRRWFDALPTFFAPFDTMKLEEHLTGDMFVVRAEMPGIDPEKDADVWIADGMLHLKVERTMEEQTDEHGVFRTEFGYGSFHRAVALPKGVKGDDVAATYKDGVLEIRLPVTAADKPVAKVPITKA